MRADRLVAIVLLLQNHGQRTAGQLAKTLEASERTIRRDLDALSGAGVPVYAQRGRGGGWALLGGHRIDLSGLTATEASSLVLAAGGAPGQDVDAAMRKVLAAMPPALRDQVMMARARVHVDRTGWRQPPGTKASQSHDSGTERALVQLRQALERGVQVDLCYARPGHEPSWRRVHPHGLVVKGGTWYLVGTAAPSGLRTYKVSRVEAAELTGEAASTPDGFDLAATWEATQRAFAALRPTTEMTVELLVTPRVWPHLSARLGAWWDLVDLGVESDGRRRALVTMANAAHAAMELVGFGDSVDVRSPPEVREELAALGRRLVDRYSAPAD